MWRDPRQKAVITWGGEMDTGGASACWQPMDWWFRGTRRWRNGALEQGLRTYERSTPKKFRYRGMMARW